MDEGLTPNLSGARKIELKEASPPSAAVPDPWSEGVFVGYSVEELRKANEVREMMPLEQGQELSSLRGVYGFVHYLRLSGAFRLLAEIDFPVNRRQNEKGVEIHKTLEDEVMVLVYVDESTAARLANAQGEVGSIFGFFRSVEGHAVLAGLPLSRVLDWEHRAFGEDGFAELRID